MQQITSAQFRAAVKLDPAWASKLTEPVEITDYCAMEDSHITHLSALLHFIGKGSSGDSAAFSNCKSLKIAEGTFKGFVWFGESGIERIGDLSCGKNNSGHSAAFIGCKSLKVAEGKFEGHVSFLGSAIEKIGDLTCGKDEDGNCASFWHCDSLKIAEGNFEGGVSFCDSSIEEIGDLSCEKNNRGIRLRVENCRNLTKIPSTFHPIEIEADPKITEKLEVDRFIQKKRAEVVEIEL